MAAGGSVGVLVTFTIFLQGCWETVASPRQIFDPCYSWPGSVYAGDGMCFLLVETEFDFKTSKAKCSDQDASLAELRTQQQREKVIEMVGSGAGQSVWLGANKTEQGDKFVWLSDQETVTAPVNWWSNSHMPEPSGDDKCLVMTATSQMSTLACQHNFLGYICQIYVGDPCDIFLPGAEYYDKQCFLAVTEKMSLPEAMKKCRSVGAFVAEPTTTTLITYLNSFAGSHMDGWIESPHSGTWVKIYRDMKPWADARAVCQAEGADLVKILDDSMNEFIWGHVSASPGQLYWIGLHDTREENSFVWLDETDNPQFFKWGRHQPNDLGTSGQDCVEMGNTRLAGGTWNDQLCTVRAKFICEKSVKAAPTITDTDSVLWLGLTKHSASEFKWSYTGDPISSANWFSNEPGGSGITDGSGVVMDGTQDWKWKVVSATSLAQVICQRDLTTECAGVLVQGRCFTYQGTQVSWLLAQDDCVGKGAHLPEPINAVLDRTIYKYEKESADVAMRFQYLGATDVETEGTYIWETTRQPLGYTNWPSYEPNGGTNENFLSMNTRTGYWNDLSLRFRSTYLCEKVMVFYAHSYVLVLPREGLGGPRSHANALISMMSHPGEKGNNSVEISTFPSGKFSTINVSDTQSSQYKVVHTDLMLDSSGPQHKYVLIRSKAPLDIIYFMYGSNRYVCSSLVFEVWPDVQQSSFFTNPGLGENSIGLISTQRKSSLITVSGSAFDQHLTFSFNGLNLESRDMLTVSRELPKQYQSMYVDTITGSETALSAHSTGALGVFSFGQESLFHYIVETNQTRDVSLDLTCDQTLPTSLVGSEYVTFPSLPTNPGVTDYFTVVALYSFTDITVYNSDGSAKRRGVFLLWPGDSADLTLPASGFYHVTGNREFYLYAKLTGEEKDNIGRTGLCSLTLFPDSLFREAYTVAAMGPLLNAASVYVAVIVRTQDKDEVVVETVDSGVKRGPDHCEGVSGTNWTGCYFHLTSDFRTGDAVFRVKMNTTNTFKFGAYLIARRNVTQGFKNLMCSPLGMPDFLPRVLDFDYTEYLKVLETKPLCEEMTTTTEATTPASEDENTTVTTILTNTTTTDTTNNGNINDTSSSSDTAPDEETKCELDISLNTTITELLKPGKMNEALQRIVTQLRVKKGNLSSVRRKKESSPDTRASSTNVGYFSIAFSGVFIGLVILADCRKLYLDVRLAMRNIGSFFS